jgi:3-oxoacyl-[acyl-carrier protein] reductase
MGDERVTSPRPTGAARVALVAGGSSAIGAAVARRLAGQGIVVYVAFHRHSRPAESAAAEIAQTGGRSEAVHLDVTDAAEADTVCEHIFSTCGSLDILVNAAAVNVEAPALGMDDEAWNRVISTNLAGAFRLCRSAAKYMVLGRWGRIVNISSAAGVRGGRGQINYAASKAGLDAMTRVLALELGRKGVLANCVAPGVIESGMSERIRRDHGQDLIESIALRRFGRPEDVAEVVAFLSSDASAYLTGQVLRVDGGLCL